MCPPVFQQVKVQPAGPTLPIHCFVLQQGLVPFRNINSHSLLGRRPRLGPPDSKILNQLGPVQRYPVHLFNVVFLGGSVAAVFPAAISQGAQSGQALWRSQQTVEREKSVINT